MVRKYDFTEAENWIPEYEPPESPRTTHSKCVTEVCSVFSGEVNWISAVLREVSQPCLVRACGLECPAYFIQLRWDRSVEQLSLRRDNKHICYLLIPWLCLYTQDRNWIKAVFLVHRCREEKVALQEPRSHSQRNVCRGLWARFFNLAATGSVRPAVTARKMTGRYGDGVLCDPTDAEWRVWSAQQIISLKSISSYWLF